MVEIVFPLGARCVRAFPPYKAKFSSLVMPDERLIVRGDEGPVAGLLDVRMPCCVHRLVTLPGDGVKPLVLQPQPLVDRGLAVFGGRHLLLALDKILAVGLMRRTLGLRFLIFG